MYFEVKLGPAGVEHLSVFSFEPIFRTFYSIKSLPSKKRSSLFSPVTKKKRLITLRPGPNVLKLFSVRNLRIFEIS